MWRAVLVVAVAHSVAAASIPLSYDESYYALWGRYPAFGYLDHPPFTAWMIHAGTALFGETTFGVRLWFVVAVVLAGLLTADLGRRLFDCATGKRAFLWFNLSLMIAAGGHLASPDTPSVLFWVLALWCLVRGRDGNPRWWLAVGLASGLGFEAKYTGLFFGAGLVLWLVWEGRLRATLRQPWLWLGGLAAVALMAPNIVWNACHGWATFDKQFGRVGDGGSLTLRYLGALIGGQILLFGILTVPFLAVGVARGCGNRGRKDRGRENREIRDRAVQGSWRLIVATSLPLILYMLVHALHARVQGNWPAPLYPAASVLAGYGTVTAFDNGQRWARRLAPAATAFGLGLAVLVNLHLAWPASDLFGPHDPVKQFRGWPAFAAQVRTLATQQGATWIGTSSYSTTARLGWALPEGPPVVQIDKRERYTFAPPPPPRLTSQPGLIVDLARRLNRARLDRCFSKVEALAPLTRGTAPLIWDRYTVYRVERAKKTLFTAGCR